MTSGQRTDEAASGAAAPDADPVREAVELAARISRRLSASDLPVARKMPTPRPPTTA